MARKRSQTQLSDSAHRERAQTSTVDAAADLQRYRQAATCDEKLGLLRDAARALADAEAHLGSIDAASRADIQYRRRLGRLSREYHRAWEHLTRRCKRR